MSQGKPFLDETLTFSNSFLFGFQTFLRVHLCFFNETFIFKLLDPTLAAASCYIETPRSGKRNGSQVCPGLNPPQQCWHWQHSCLCALFHERWHRKLPQPRWTWFHTGPTGRSTWAGLLTQTETRLLHWRQFWHVFHGYLFYPVGLHRHGSQTGNMVRHGRFDCAPPYFFVSPEAPDSCSNFLLTPALSLETVQVETLTLFSFNTDSVIQYVLIYLM